jgi:hypothetical protein
MPRPSVCADVGALGARALARSYRRAGSTQSAAAGVPLLILLGHCPDPAELAPLLLVEAQRHLQPAPEDRGNPVLVVPAGTLDELCVEVHPDLFPEVEVVGAATAEHLSQLLQRRYPRPA